MFSSVKLSWATPKSFFDSLDKEFKFTLDACASSDNAKCENYFSLKDDGLAQDWSGNVVFCNPPYGRGIKSWIKKAYEESLKGNTKVVMLIPSRTDTKYWHEFIFPYASDIRFIKGRLKFGGHKNSAPFPSAIVIFRDSPVFDMQTIGVYERKM